MHRPRFYNIPFIGVMIVLFFAPILQMKFEFFPEHAIYEKRDLEPRPNVQDFVDAKLFLQKLEAYFNDHFGFRNALIPLSAYLQFTLFKRSPVSKVILGKDGFLFFNFQTNGVSLSDFQGVNLFKDKEIEEIKAKWRVVKEEMEKRKIHFFVVIAPNKATIYPENLPDYYQKKRGKITQSDQVVSIFSEIGINVIDLRSPLLAIKQTTTVPLYYKTDTHWNALGAFWGYNIICHDMAKFFPDIDTRDISDYSVKVFPASGRRFDLANMANLGSMLEDSYVVMKGSIPGRTLKQKTVDGSQVYEGDDTTLPKLVVFHDSFFLALESYVREHFSRSVFFWKKYISFDTLDKEKPDAVIFEFVERNASFVVNPTGNM